jgi:hypothetical protein
METPTATLSNRMQETPPAEVNLRIVGGSRDGQLVRLHSSKCSIGSDRGCTLRLRARGIRPLHCLIVRGREATIIRRWSPDTRLNGSSFTDARLVAGDRLSIGPIEFEVVVDSQSPRSSDATSQPTPRTEQAAQLLEIERTSLRQRQSEWEEVRSRAVELLDQRTREMVEKLATMKTEQRSLTAQQKQMELERATLHADHEKLRDLIADHEQQQEHLEAARAKVESARTQLEANLEQARAEGLTHESAGLSEYETLQAIKKEQQAWEAERRRREDRLRLRAQQIERRQEDAEAELNEQKLNLDQEADQLDQINRQLQDAVSVLDENKKAWQKHRDDQMTELTAEARRMEQLRQQMDDERRAWEEHREREEAETSQRSERLQVREDELTRRQGQLDGQLQTIDEAGRDLQQPADQRTPAATHDEPSDAAAPMASSQIPPVDPPATKQDRESMEDFLRRMLSGTPSSRHATHVDLESVDSEPHKSISVSSPQRPISELPPVEAITEPRTKTLDPGDVTI